MAAGVARMDAIVRKIGATPEFVEAGRQGEELLVWRAHYLPIQPTLAQHRAILLAS